MSSTATWPEHDAVPAAARARETNALVGMVIFVASWGVLFAGLFFSYGVIRVRATEWPPLDLPRLPKLLPALATGGLVLSSLLLQRALGALRRAQGRPLGSLLAAFALGAGFLALQLFVWRQMWLAGLRPETGTYASVFYSLTAFHALHVVVGLVALLYLAARLATGAYGRLWHVPVRLWTIYWHMVGVIWGVMFVVVYLV